MVSLVEEEVAVTPYFLQLKADLCFFKSSSFFLPLRTFVTHRMDTQNLFSCPSDVRTFVTHLFFGRQGKKQASPGAGTFFYRLGRRRRCKKFNVCEPGVILPPVWRVASAPYFQPLIFTDFSLQKKVCMGSAESAAIVSLKFFPHFMFAATANGKGRCESFCHHWPWQRTLQPAFHSMNSPFQSMKP